MTANKPMTGEQLDELMTVAVNFQRDSEKAGERSCANFAYAVQVAVLELRKVRTDVMALAAENAGMKQLASEACDEMASHHDDDGLYSLDADGEQMDALIRLCDAQATIYDTLVMCETPATDAFLAEVRASAIPEGYALVPQEMTLSAEAMEGICFHCGYGGFAFGEFTDGILFVGAIDDSDGQKIHGLHIATADYPGEGCTTVCEFLPVPTQGAAQ